MAKGCIKKAAAEAIAQNCEEDPLTETVIGFFTAEVDLPSHHSQGKGNPQEAKPGEIWWEEGEGWLYPWRIVRHTDAGATGYPCGEPKRVTTR